MQLKDDMKLINEQSKFKKYCKYCGHTMTFYHFENDRKICSYCGRYNYRNDEVKFKILLNQKRRELKYENS